MWLLCLLCLLCLLLQRKNQGETQKQSRRDVGCDSICHGGCNAPVREDSTRTGALPALIFVGKVMLYQNHGQEEFAFFVFCRNYSHSHTRFLTQPIVWSHPSENGILDYMHNYPMIMPCYIRPFGSSLRCFWGVFNKVRAKSVFDVRL